MTCSQPLQRPLQAPFHPDELSLVLARPFCSTTYVLLVCYSSNTDSLASTNGATDAPDSVIERVRNIKVAVGVKSYASRKKET